MDQGMARARQVKAQEETAAGVAEIREQLNRIENMLKMLSAEMEVVKSLFPTSKASKPAEPDKTYQPKKAGA